MCPVLHTDGKASCGTKCVGFFLLLGSKNYFQSTCVSLNEKKPKSALRPHVNFGRAAVSSSSYFKDDNPDKLEAFS